MSIYSILDSIREAATSERDKGDRFEKLMLAYFRAEPTYQAQFRNVWLWSDWKGNKGLPDTGIDLVAENIDDDGFTAIQCKMYAPTTTLDKHDIDSFFTESGKAPFTHRIIVSTTNLWTVHAENSLKGQDKPVRRIGIESLDNSAIDWSEIDPFNFSKLKLRKAKSPLPHQTEAIEKTLRAFSKDDRGKLIMACGTGKTYTAQRISEALVGRGGTVLVLLPSIFLLSQTVKSWTVDASIPISVFAVCSDAKAGKKKEDEDLSPYDLEIPATTDVDNLVAQISRVKSKEKMLVVFSTYQSIEIIEKAQKKGIQQFDLIIADEAHRTTGITLTSEENSAFTKVHSNDFVKAKKRLYMTATPRVYQDTAKAKAETADAWLASMDDEEIFGKELYKLGFHEAVQKDLLTDYKVIILSVNEEAVTAAFQQQLSDENHELKLDDATKIIGCLNVFAKHDPTNSYFVNDRAPMQRVVAFSNTIANSKKFMKLFTDVSHGFLKYTNSELSLRVEVQHVDGSFNSYKRDELLGWLKTEPELNDCKVLTNAKCLTEGVDVPSLDGIVFLEPRNSMVDVVQAVGRVMRKDAGKKYGYVILPIGIPAGVTLEEALSDNKRYAQVWQVLNALRSHDRRMDAIINKLDLNKEDPNNIEIVPVGFNEDESVEQPDRPKALQMTFPLEEIRQAIFAKIVEKVGTSKYLETWAKDVAQIAERHVAQINELLGKPNSKVAKEFKQFLKGLRGNLNESITQEDAVEMLAQHLITKPVFDAIFGDSVFTEKNPVSVVMQDMVTVLSEKFVETDLKTLNGFYGDVRVRVAGIDNLDGKQKIITELYEKFFTIAFKKTVDKLGIVYTPIEIVDFMIKSVEEILIKHFESSLGKKNVEILDPFTGTGTFIARLMQSGIIATKDLPYKYSKEMNANELILLAYYIAAINIESVYHEIVGGEYQAFEGVVLTDTFQMFEDDDQIDTLIFPKNNERVLRQKNAPIKVILGNPPYSIGQETMNDNNSKVKYPTLDGRIAATYAAGSSSQLLKGIYDSYIRAFRWASDRLKGDGVIAFVTNASFIDGKAMDGFRKSLTNEFAAIYIFNLKGNQRTQGESSKQEGGKIFGSGSRTPVAITILVKKKSHDSEPKIYYSEIGDYLTREQKLGKIRNIGAISKVEWASVQIDKNGDWINQRNDSYMQFDPLAERQNPTGKEIFLVHSLGVATSRDSWAYNFSSDELEKNIKFMISNYASVLKELRKNDGDRKSSSLFVEKLIADNSNSKKITWDQSLKDDLARRKDVVYDADCIRTSLYRPFAKKYLYFNKSLNARHYQINRIFPTASSGNLVMSINQNPSKDFGLIMTDVIPDLQLTGNGQCFPLYLYRDGKSSSATLFDNIDNEVQSNISEETLKKYRQRFGKGISDEDVFYYVYGLLHSREYREEYKTDLAKVIPRIPISKNFHEFAIAGKRLSDLHISYEDAPLFKLEGYVKDFKDSISNLRFDKKNGKTDRTTVIVNEKLILKGIPDEVDLYSICGRSGVEWVLDRYEVKQDSNTGITQDPGLWNPTENYVVNLICRVVSVSLETVKIVASLPAIDS